MTIGEYFENLKALADHAGADKTGVKIETDDGYCIDITVTKKQNKKVRKQKWSVYEKPEI